MKQTKVALVKRAQIDYGNRYREDFGDLNELAADMKEKGIIQPLAVYQPNPKEEKYLLLAGGRRFYASERAGIEELPVNIYFEKLSDLEIRGIELAENLYRKDLEWKEQIRLQQEIHRLYQEVHGKKVARSPDAPGWSERDTANLVGRSQGSVHQDIVLADALTTAPELFDKCKNKHEANKVLKGVREGMLKEELSRRYEEELKKGGAVEDLKLANSFCIGDFCNMIRQIPDGTINLVEFDPPYGIDLKHAKRLDSPDITEHLQRYNEIDVKDYIPWMTNALKECYRVMTPHSWLILWFGPDPWFEPMYQLLNKVGFTTNRLPGIWLKGTGQTKRPENRLANGYEMFFYARKGDPSLVKKGRTNVFDFPPVPPTKKRHPTQRPIELMMELLSTFGDVGSSVLVPCLGSGVTLEAAHQLGMDAFGYELSEECKRDFLVAINQ